MSAQPTVVWAPTPARILSVVALVLLILATLAYHKTITGLSGDTFLAAGLAFWCAAGVL